MSAQQHQTDEGFHSQPASDTTSQPDADDSIMLDTDDGDEEDVHYGKLKAGLLRLPNAKRLKLVADVCNTLPTALLFDLHNTIGGLVYFDPVTYLPTELVLSIFSYLPPKDILTASLVSRPWRERSHDERLWHDCFGREGWILDTSRMTRHEDLARKRGGRAAERFMRMGKLPAPSLERRESRKRVRDEAFNSENESTQARTTAKEGHIVEGDVDDSGSMSGVELEAPSPAARFTRSGQSRSRRLTTEASMDTDAPAESNALRVQPPVFSASTEPQISWPYLYKQRRRLEKNWDLGKYKMFQLPHPQHPEEGHRECVYTIQHSGSWVVSGSRDKSIRIWDLSTYRLKVPPLEGHEASVLCLQFDERPDDKHDIIVSGGSDNYVVVWKFSTGHLVKKWQAHNESVLNLRFDDRYLVTCSKDKTIKIWNRHAIDSDDPIVPNAGRDVDIFPRILKQPILEPYSLLKTMTGHQAAVNAVQIQGDIIVSASGDRTIKSWDIHGENFKRSYTGHTKGIACVQFDGRRIVSGSSDNSVRIFDFETSAEVACLDGHSNLVRTVQARFGDMQISSEELAEDSRRVDEEFLRRLGEGMRPAEASRRRQPRNAGSWLPEHMLAYGTKVPPGGGGSRWAKIVSGSYDETVIVWKRNKDGNWHPSLRLHQGMLLSHPATTRVRATAVVQPANLHNINAQTAPGQPAAAVQQTNQHLMAQAQSQLNQVNAMLQNPPTVQNHNQSLSQSHAAAVNASQANLAQQIQSAQQHQQPLNHVTTTHGTIPTGHGTVMHSTMITTHSLQQPAAAGPANQGAPAPPSLQAAPAPQAGPANNAPNAAPGHHHHGHHHHHHGQAGNANGGGGGGHRESNRVFKLQFDARRIISCSQNKVIVGWDFANGDKDLEWIGDWSVETA